MTQSLPPKNARNNAELLLLTHLAACHMISLDEWRKEATAWADRVLAEKQGEHGKKSSHRSQRAA